MNSPEKNAWVTSYPPYEPCKIDTRRILIPKPCKFDTIAPHIPVLTRDIPFMAQASLSTVTRSHLLLNIKKARINRAFLKLVAERTN